LSGTPAVGTGGSYPLTLTANNGVGSASQAFTLTVDQSLVITSSASTTFTVGTLGTFTPTASGFPSPSITESGALPSGVIFTSGVLSGTPNGGTGGVYDITFTAANGVGSASQAFALTVDQGPAITSSASTTFIVGTAESFTLAATGFPAPTFSESGALPSGLTFNSASGTLSGTPNAGAGGSYSLTFTAANGSATTSQSFTLIVDEP